MLKELFEKNRDIIINTDIDGFLCGAILVNYFNCRIVGFSNSKKEIWVTKDVKSIYDPVYIDLYVVRDDVTCIEQHIIAKDNSHHLKIRDLGTKINPNIERGRTFKGDGNGDYYHKYPFGTIHYLITLMAREGIHIDLPSLTTEVKDLKGNLGMELGQVILRADDALYSTLSAYADNAEDWWAYLDPGYNFPAINALRRYIKSCNRSLAKEYKDKVGYFFKKTLNCDGADGAFTYILDSNGYLQERVKRLWEMVCVSLNLPENIKKNYRIS